MFNFKKVKPENIQRKRMLPFKEMIPDEPSLVKVAYIAFKEYFDKRGITTDDIIVSEFDASNRFELDFMLEDEFLIRSNVAKFIPLMDVTAKQVYDDVHDSLAKCESESVSLKLKFLDL